jgi:hypothetical protein
MKAPRLILALVLIGTMASCTTTRKSTAKASKSMDSTSTYSLEVGELHRLGVVTVKDTNTTNLTVT